MSHQGRCWTLQRIPLRRAHNLTPTTIASLGSREQRSKAPPPHLRIRIPQPLQAAFYPKVPCCCPSEKPVSVEQAAFREDHNVIRLVQDSLKDPTARPFLSLLAFQEDEPVGHILFTTAHLDTDPYLSVALLAPLAVVPKFQRQGIGGQLIEGVKLLKESGVELIFVTGHPSYYPRHGFRPASEFGFEPPYPMPAEYPDAWMVREVSPGAIHKHSGRFLCAKAIDKPEYWEDE